MPTRYPGVNNQYATTKTLGKEEDLIRNEKLEDRKSLKQITAQMENSEPNIFRNQGINSAL
jgi:hypothetical protein